MGLSSVPIANGEKRPVPEAKGFAEYSRSLISQDRLNSLTRKFPFHGIGLVLGAEVKPGFKLMAVDIDDDRFVRFVTAVIGGFPCAKRGQKGLTGFVLAPKDMKIASARLRNAELEKAVVELLGDGLQTVLPPTIHPDTENPYVWLGKELLDMEFDALPILQQRHVKLIERVVQSEHVLNVISGSATHEPMLRLVAQGLTQLEEDDDYLERVIYALLPEDYSGDTNEQIMPMIKTAREKNMGWRRMGYEPGDEGPKPMGYTDDSRYVFIDARRQLKVLTASQVTTKPNLLDMAKRSFWISQFPILNKNGEPYDLDHVRAGDTLMDLCREEGPFILSNVRGRGVWREGNRVVVNTGEQVSAEGKYTYICFDPLVIKEQTQDIQPQRVQELLKLFCWKNPLDADLLFGWLVLAPACGALEWRPHMFLHGPKNSGKTTVLHMIAKLLDPMVIKLDGQSSEAGIRQKLKADSLPVILDEFESDGSANRMANIIRLARSASSGEDAVARGTPEGRVMEFLIRATFLFGAINPRVVTPADASRIVCIELVPHSNSRDTKGSIERLVSEVSGYSPSWCQQAMRLVPLIEPTVKVLRAALPPMDSRHVLNMATLMAGTWLGVEGARVPSADEALAFAGKYEHLLVEHAAVHDEDDAHQCWQYLLGFPLNGAAVADWISYHIEGEVLLEQSPGTLLRSHGMRILPEGLLVANNAAGLEKIFAGTRWAQGAWVTALRRLPGSSATDATLFSDKKSRATLISKDNFDSQDRPVIWKPAVPY